MNGQYYVKNMVCRRCIGVLREALTQRGLAPVAVELGVVRFAEPLGTEQMKILRAVAEKNDFTVIDDERQRLIEAVKRETVRYVRTPAEDRPAGNFSEYLAEVVAKPYPALSALFSQMEGRTVERYLIAQKVEYVKELLTYGELLLGEVAHLLGYSSTAHLSGQFRRETGLTPSQFRQVGQDRRRPLDQV